MTNSSDVTRRLAAEPAIQNMLLEMERLRRERVIESAKADPVKHKLTLQFAGKPASYRYIPAGKDGRGRTVRFCYSCHRNAAGYFLGWREVQNRKGEGFRDRWIASRTKKRVQDSARKRAAAFKAAANKGGDHA